jgi:hypothetical protein
LKALTWWFRIVGAFFVLGGVAFLPPLTARRLPSLAPGFEASPGSVAHDAFLDYIIMVGFDGIVVGLFLLYASREPLRYLPLVWLVVWLELARGILDDIYMIARGYSPGIFIAFIGVHAIVIATGLLALRRAKAEAAT